VIETNHDEKLLQADPHRPWPVKQRIMSRHGHLSNTSAAVVISELLPGGKIERVVLGHLSRDCNTPDLACTAVRTTCQNMGKGDIEVFCASQTEVSPRFTIGETKSRNFQPTLDDILFCKGGQPGAPKLGKGG
jgi:hypothetical protein